MRHELIERQTANIQSPLSSRYPIPMDNSVFNYSQTVEQSSHKSLERNKPPPTSNFSPSVFMKTASLLTMVVIFVNYWIAQYYKHQPKFPHCWISGVADHFPQYVLFRIATISGSALLCLGWIINYFYIKTIARDHVWMNKTKPIIATIIGSAGAIFLMFSTALIDTGTQNGSLHGFCASRFFILTLIAQLYNTVVHTVCYKATKGVSLSSLALKWFFEILVIIQLWVSIQYGVEGVWWVPFGAPIGYNNRANSALNNDVGKFLEWTLSYTVLMYFYFMSKDVTKYRMVYEETSNVQINQTNSIRINRQEHNQA